MTADRPLSGRRVLVARAEGQAAPLSDRIRSLGGEPVEAPVLEIEEGDLPALRHAVLALADGAFVAVCLTSPNGVDALAAALDEAGLGADVLSRARLVACVGPGTADALRDRLGVRPGLVPDEATTRALGEAVPPGSGKVLLPRADIASPELAELLTAKGYEPVDVAAYRTRAPTALPAGVLDDLAHGRIDLLAFGSSSTVHNFVALVGDRPWRGAVVSIGPVTSSTCRELGIDVAVEAEHHDLDGLVAALVRAAT